MKGPCILGGFAVHNWLGAVVDACHGGLPVIDVAGETMLVVLRDMDGWQEMHARIHEQTRASEREWRNGERKEKVQTYK